MFLWIVSCVAATMPPLSFLKASGASVESKTREASSASEVSLKQNREDFRARCRCLKLFSLQAKSFVALLLHPLQSSVGEL